MHLAEQCQKRVRIKIYIQTLFLRLRFDTYIGRVDPQIRHKYRGRIPYHDELQQTYSPSFYIQLYRGNDPDRRTVMRAEFA